jgi:hypothetical protein
VADIVPTFTPAFTRGSAFADFLRANVLLISLTAADASVMLDDFCVSVVKPESMLNADLLATRKSAVFLLAAVALTVPLPALSTSMTFVKTSFLLPFEIVNPPLMFMVPSGVVSRTTPVPSAGTSLVSTLNLTPLDLGNLGLRLRVPPLVLAAPAMGAAITRAPSAATRPIRPARAEGLLAYTVTPLCWGYAVL